MRNIICALLGKLLYAVDGNGMLTRYEYDAYGRIRKQTRPTIPDATLRSVLLTEVPGLIIENFEAPINDYTYEYENIYDANGNVIQKIDAMGKVTENKFDELNRLVHVKDPGLNMAMMPPETWHGSHIKLIRLGPLQSTCIMSLTK